MVFARPKLRKLKRIAIDEICIGKGVDALEPFWERLRHSKARKIKAVAIDMSSAYISAVGENLPDASIVFDHFHIIKLFNAKLSDPRRGLFREATDFLKKHMLKNTRWLLLTGQ